MSQRPQPTLPRRSGFKTQDIHTVKIRPPHQYEHIVIRCAGPFYDIKALSEDGKSVSVSAIPDMVMGCPYNNAVMRESTHLAFFLGGGSFFG